MSNRDIKEWQKSKTGMYHNGYCNGAIRNRPLFLEGPKRSLNELEGENKNVSKYYQVRICKKCLNH